jgi:MFS family permease
MSASSRTYAGYVVFLLFLANIANYGQRMLVSILLPAIQADVALSDAQLGILMGGGFALMYAIAGVPLARFADRRGRGRWLAIALVFWSTTTALFGMTQAFSQMLVARIALGIGESLCIPTSHSLLTDFVAPANRAFAFGLHSTGAVVGVTLALILGGSLEASVGWRHAMVLAALPGILLGFVIAATLREPSRSGADAPALKDAVPLHEVIAHLLSLKSYRWVLTSVCFGMLVEYGLNQWLPTYYVREFGLSVAEVGFRYGLTVAVGGIPGSLLGGLLATYLARRDIRWLVWFPALMYAIAIPIGLSMLLASTARTALILNGVYAFAIFTTNGPLWAACFVHVPPLMRATTSAITLLVAGITGLALGPTLVGGISGALTARAGSHALQGSLVAVECLAVAVVISLFYASFALRLESQSRRPDAVALPIPSIAR